MEIYGTLGPSCQSIETLEEMFRAGMTGIRLNLSHISLSDAAEEIALFHRAAANCGKKAKLLVDLQGPELRLPALNAPLSLREGEIIPLGIDGVPLPKPVIPFLRTGQELLLDDGKLLLRVTDLNNGGFVRAVVVRGGLLRGRKSVALPGVEVHLPTLTDSDIQNIRHARDYGVTGVMQPFVRGQEDLKVVRQALDDAGGQSIRLFAKVEHRSGVEHLEEFFAYSDEVVIARGDLGNSVPLWELPALQKRIALSCNRAGVPFMVVTQMLTSMEKNPVPTRAEVNDIFHSVLDGASSVMVTGETAVGRYPVEVIRVLSRTAQEALHFLHSPWME